MSFNYRFEPPTAYELEEMVYCECPYEHKQCETCWFDCDEDEGDTE